MADLFNEYKSKKQSKRKNIAIIFTAFVFALSINLFLFNTDTGRNLQTSVINIWEKNATQEFSDIYLEKTSTWVLSLKVGANLQNVSEIRSSILFDTEWTSLVINPTNLENKFLEKNNWELKNISNTPWVNLINIKFSKPVNIKKWETLIYISTTKKITWNTVINLAETNFVSGKDTFELSNNSLEY